MRFTNTAPVDAYRGAGRPEATYLLERLVTRCANWEMGLTRTNPPRNFITQFPHQTPVIAAVRRRRLPRLHGQGAGSWPTWPASSERKAASAKPRASCAASATPLHRGLRHRAVGNIAGALGARAGLFECGEIRVTPVGSVTVFTGSHSHGQGHETTFAQVVAARLGHRHRQRRRRARRHRPRAVRHGHLRLALHLVGGAAIMKALDKIEAKAKKIAAA
jgi:carbon-monoxide dehydrogenase large subunit